MSQIKLMCVTKSLVLAQITGIGPNRLTQERFDQKDGTR
jgi:hypothetical protein